MIKSLKKKTKNAESGMTFIELIVVLGIFAAISSTVLFNYHNFSENVALQNLAQDIALQIKQAQTEAVSGRIPVLMGTGQVGNPALIGLDWKPSYGIAFNLNNDWPLGKKGFIYYFNSASDTDVNGVIYNDLFDFERASYGTTCGFDPDSECLQEIKITSGDFIDMICLGFTTIAETCDGTSSQTAYISFTRPRGNAKIMEFDDGSAGADNAFIRISSPSGSHKYVSVYSSGYISVN